MLGATSDQPKVEMMTDVNEMERADMVDRETLVRERAYAIWEREGRPEGGAEAHWWEAEAEIAAELGEPLSDDAPMPAGSDVTDTIIDPDADADRDPVPPAVPLRQVSPADVSPATGSLPVESAEPPGTVRPRRTGTR